MVGLEEGLYVIEVTRDGECGLSAVLAQRRPWELVSAETTSLGESVAPFRSFVMRGKATGRPLTATAVMLGTRGPGRLGRGGGR